MRYWKRLAIVIRLIILMGWCHCLVSFLLVSLGIRFISRNLTDRILGLMSTTRPQIIRLSVSPSVSSF